MASSCTLAARSCDSRICASIWAGVNEFESSERESAAAEESADRRVVRWEGVDDSSVLVGADGTSAVRTRFVRRLFVLSLIHI